MRSNQYSHIRGATKGAVSPTAAVLFIQIVKYICPDIFNVVDESVATGVATAGISYMKNLAKHYFNLPF